MKWKTGYGGIGLVALAVTAVLLVSSCATVPEEAHAPPEEAPASEKVEHGEVVQTIALTYKTDDDIRKNIGYVGSQGMQLNYRPSKKLTYPPVFSKMASYGRFRLGEGPDAFYSFVVDESRGTGSGFDKLYIDQNQNDDLTDDPVIEVAKKEDYQSTFSRIMMQSDYDGKKQPYYISFFMYNRGNYARIMSGGYCEGEIKLSGGTYKIAVFDDNVDGKFNTPTKVHNSDTIYLQGDSFVIDFNRDGKYAKDYRDTEEMFAMTKWLVDGKDCLHLSFSEDGRSLILAKAACDMAVLEMPSDSYSVELVNKQNPLKLRNAKKVKIPVGEYKLARCSFAATDDKGKQWRIAGQGTSKQDAVLLAKGESAEMQFGPPFIASVKTSKQGSNQFRFNLEMKGQGSEIYSAGNISHEGKRSKTPRFEVRNADGKRISSGNFEYG